jgi:hypothetical protein
MLRLLRSALLVATLLSSVQLLAQKKGFFLTVGKSSDNSFTKGKEAEVIGTFPDSTDIRSWLTNAFIEFGYKTNSKLKFGLTGEIHRNSLIDKPQYVEQFGVSGEYSIITSKDETETAKAEIPLTLSIENSHDRLSKETALQIFATASFNKYTGTSLLRSRTSVPSLKSGLAHLFQFSQAHSLGLAMVAEDQTILLGTLDLEANVFLFPRLVDRWTNQKYVDLFRIQLSYQGRTRFAGESNLDLNALIDLQCGINIRLGDDGNNTLGIAYDWIRGANPFEGLANQRYETLTAKVKFSIP